MPPGVSIFLRRTPRESQDVRDLIITSILRISVDNQEQTKTGVDRVKLTQLLLDRLEQTSKYRVGAAMFAHTPPRPHDDTFFVLSQAAKALFSPPPSLLEIPIKNTDITYPRIDVLT